ncbi:hypothetical protein LX15_002112 [Streptoalloteichus tenebrarius]|uniref:Secreted protein n=1 Tax=Streptoalloteichus tenebrarius (strain ATCC 17920 / DSM 40477 / JCM 4838 / CBS 697.72 / NBRC 16177 / NCIMB 11028 / NRRL B-12390 / A12253. 1 / ISP 5477) TaxID=1933 RepID=A0ABT1HSB4_STRSD|nr:hypothetical protein [Streptoalloteichus tenebrarius]MCP2258418.1 hypothetical protein [Streptoalloteichus tenebrarius]BFF03589.1 hypothetical protein GCM10020241_52640 [Streptoalloteichus tenebrarius]
MSRLFWFALGAAAGVMVTRKATETARQATPAGIAANVSDALRELAGAVGSFGAEVRAGMSERERELHTVVERRTGGPAGAVEGGWTPPAALPWAGSDLGQDRTARRSPARRSPGARARRAGG